MFKNLFYVCAVTAVVVSSVAFADCANGKCPREMIERHRQERGYYSQQGQSSDPKQNAEERSAKDTK